MNLEILELTPSWEWPKDAGQILLDTLQDDGADASDRLLAAELAGEIVAIDDRIADALLATIASSAAPDDLRGTAAIALGPVLELADTEGFDGPFDLDDLPISEEMFDRIQAELRSHFRNSGIPKEVRRRILEASVRAPRDWHKDAVRASYYSDDPAWRLTGVFGMRFVSSFDSQILEALQNDDPEIHYQALRAAGAWGVPAAWPHIRTLIRTDPTTETSRDLRLAAIEAAGSMDDPEAAEVLESLALSEDEAVVAAAEEALLMMRFSADWDAEDDGEGDENELW